MIYLFGGLNLLLLLATAAFMFMHSKKEKGALFIALGTGLMACSYILSFLTFIPFLYWLVSLAMTVGLAAMALGALMIFKGFSSPEDLKKMKMNDFQQMGAQFQASVQEANQPQQQQQQWPQQQQQWQQPQQQQQQWPQQQQQWPQQPQQQQQWPQQPQQQQQWPQQQQNWPGYGNPPEGGGQNK